MISFFYFFGGMLVLLILFQLYIYLVVKTINEAHKND